ncbi:hemagglutinin repeat-containing protein [Aliarcobacter butzleri]|uniref:two-partner secretion domain-containing protein n=1 Tax=Aliarcobacter butzleri TaxID=28197 RepID=UPI00263CE745|nr:hemagglutinin repeat-containing protein [Aliarcobacter butzleri]MDN5089595.1 hemagglutinin repeat-containing protein [Aliarcobacter butzleri]
MKIIKRIISIKISCLLVAQQSLIAGGLAVDKTAPTSNQANLESARNGVPIVNIVAPNQKGLSHNKFSDYNVNKEGLILNNSNKREVNTQLSGYIYGNQNLKNGTAKTILNEVTSKNKSELKGFTEVAGDRANVVVANPNGIYINGAGFINTSRATITTGNPNIKNGEIDSFDVRQGQIDVDGTGLNLSNVNKAELYAQTVKLNAKIHSQDLDVVTGQNSISKDGTITNIENSSDEKPTLSIDSSALGGIYANKISLVGTQKGVGVNLPIEISAQDDFKLSADGKIVLDKVISEKSIDIKSDSSDINTKTIYGNNVNIEAKNSIKNEDVIASKTNIDLKANNIENKDANIQAVKDITITSKNIDNSKGTISSNNNLELDVFDFKGNNSTIQASNIDIKANDFEANSSNIVATNGNLDIKVNNLDLDNSLQIGALDNINIKSNEAKLNNTKIVSQKGNMSFDTNSLELEKSIVSASKYLDINTTYLKNTQGNIQALEDINITSKDIDNQDGKIATNKNLLLNSSNFQGDNSKLQASNIDVKANNFQANNSKIVAMDGNLNIESKDLEINNSNITSLENIDIKTDNLKSKNGNIQAVKDISIASKDIDNENGVIATNENLTINSSKDGFFNNIKGKLQSGKKLVLDIFNFKGDNSNVQASNIDIKANNFEAKSSNIVTTNENLNIETNSFILEDSYLNIKNNLSLNSKNSLNLKDNTIVGNNLNISADEIYFDGTSQNKNILYSTNDILINTKKLISNYLFTQANNNINIDSSTIDLKNSKLQSVVFIDSVYQNGYKQGDINLTTSNLNLYNTTLASKDINIKKGTNQKLQTLAVENSSLDVNNNIDVSTTTLNAKKSLFSALNDLLLTTDKSIVFLNNNFSANNLSLTIDENLTLDKSNSFLANNNFSLNTKSLVNNAQIISNGKLTINTNDFIVNNALLSSKNILSLNATNYILNNDSNEPIFGIRGAVTNLNTRLLTNYGFITSLYDMNIKVDDLINYAGIASANSENKTSNLNIEANNLTNYNTIYSNDNINLYIKNRLKNITDNKVVTLGNEKATIFATNNITMQGDKDKSLRTDEIINDKSIIQTQYGDINIYANSFKNLNDEATIGTKNNGSNILFFVVTNGFNDLFIATMNNLGENEIIEKLKAENIEVTTEKVLEKLREKYSFLSHMMTPVYSPSNGFFNYYLRITNPSYKFVFSKNYLINYSTQSDYFIYKPLLENGGKILSNRNINFDSLNIENKISTISAKNNILFTDSILNNKSNSIYQYSTITGGSDFCPDKCTSFLITPSSNQTKIDSLDSIIEAGNSINGSLIELNNENKARISNVEFTTYSPSQNTKVQTANIQTDKKTVESKNIEEKNTSAIKVENKVLDKIVLNPIDENYILPTNKYSTFTTVNPNKNLDYLVESNPLYTDYSNFIGSSYFLEKMNYQGDKTMKRLGDAAYETKLVSDAIFKQTGQRFLSQDYTSENTQFVSLMNNAVNLSGVLGLELGKPLTASQLVNLTEDIVWMEEKVVNGQTVLVPVVYLAKDYNKSQGAVISAKNIDLNIKDNLVNSGTIKTNDYLNLNANSIINNSGVILSSGKATLISNDDFINKNGGLIKANDIQIASLNGNVINETYSKQNYVEFGINNFTYTNIGKTSSIEATNGNLVIQAKNDITNIGGNLGAKESVLLQTQNGDINLNVIELKNSYNNYFKGGFSKGLDINYQSSNIDANNIIMQSGKDINLEASKLNAINQINLNAKNDVNIEALNNVYYRDTQTTKKGTFSKTTQRDMVYKESVNSAELNANDILINANNDVNLQAAKLKAQDNIIVNAKDGDVNIVAKEYREGELHEKSKSSWGGLKKSLDISSTDALKLNSALLKTEASNVVLTSGKDINILASEINSGADIQLKALNDVLIASQSEYLKTQEVHKKSSFNLAGLTSLVVPVDTTIYSSEIHKNDKLSSSSVASKLNANKDILIDSGSTTIAGSNLEANNIGIKADTGEINILSSQDVQNATSLDKEIKLGLSDPIKGVVQNTKNMFSGETKVKFEVGSLTYDEVDKASQTTKNNSSNLKAKENLVLDSLTDINVQGSNLKAGENLVLNSKVGDINILNTTDTYNEDIKEKHAKASVNVTVQNEYVETAQAVKSAVKSAEQLKQTKDDYSKYKGEVKKLESTLSDLKQRYKAKEVGIDYSDIEDLSDFIDNLKSQEKYYVAAIAAATADLASKTAAIATQAAAAYSSSITWGFSAGISLDVNGEKSKQNINNQTSNASNLNGKNIYINTDEKLSTNTNVVGSNVIADENLYINTNNLNVKASQDNYTSKNDSESINGSIAFTMYGGGGGTAGLGFGKSNSSSDSFLNNNSQLSGNNVNINVTNDANFVGANVRANDTLNLNVGNNLVLESLRDEYSSNSKGFNVNAGIGFGSAGKEGHRTPSLDVGKQSSTNAGFSVNNGVTQNKQTVLSSITGDKVNVNVGNNTHLKGSLLASGNYDDNGNFVDNKNLNLTTDTLTFGNLSNSTYSSSKSLGVNVNYNLEDKKVENAQEKPQQKGISSVGYQAENSLSANASKTLATLGQGNVTVKDIENSDELDRLNRDTTAVNKDLYSSSTGTKVDATLDTRLLTKDGQEQIAKEFEQLADNVDTLNRYLKDNLGNNKLTEDKKIAIQNDINSLGKEEALAKALRENGVSEEDIKRVLENENIQKLFGNAKDMPSSYDSNKEQNSQTTVLEGIKTTEPKNLQHYLIDTAQGINELVNIVGEDKVAGAIFVTQILLQGSLKTGQSLLADEVNDYLTSGVKNKLSNYIANEYFDINKEVYNTNQQNAIKNISDISSGFAIDTLISGGAFGIIKGAGKLDKTNKDMDSVLNNTNHTIDFNKIDNEYSKISTAKSYQSNIPRDLKEQILWKDVVENPSSGSLMKIDIKDPRFRPEDGWEKKYKTHTLPDGRTIEIHYQYNKLVDKAYDIKMNSPKYD